MLLNNGICYPDLNNINLKKIDWTALVVSRLKKNLYCLSKCSVITGDTNASIRSGSGFLSVFYVCLHENIIFTTQKAGRKRSCNI